MIFELSVPTIFQYRSTNAYFSLYLLSGVAASLLRPEATPNAGIIDWICCF